MAPAVERREPIGQRFSDRSMSPVKNRHSPRERCPPGKASSPTRRRSRERTKSPQRPSSSHRRSPAKEKASDRGRPPKSVRGRSPTRTSSSRSPSPRTKRLRRTQAESESEKGKGGEHVKNSREVRNKVGEGGLREKGRTSASRSPSPRTKRLRRTEAERESEKGKGGEHVKSSREECNKMGEGEFKEKGRISPSQSPRSKRLLQARAEREAEKSKDREHGRNTGREEHDRGRHGEHGDTRYTLSERRSEKDKIDGGVSRSSRHDRSVSPARHGRSVPPEPNRRSKHSSRSPSSLSRDGAREEVSRSRMTEHSRDGDLDSVARMKAAEETLEAKEKDKQKPSFELSGKLAEETNRVRGVTLLFNEPADARKPDVRWRLYVFKAGEGLNEPLYVHRQSCYLFGRERRVADIPTDHPSCSKQHAVIQYRLVEKEQHNGLLSKQVRPYLMDLGSTNGTFINDSRLEPQRYYELFEKDTIRFGNSSREYVILHENSAA